MDLLCSGNRSVAMRRQLLCSGCSLIGMAFLFQLAACSKSNPSPPDAVAMDSGTSDGGCKASAPDNSYVLIADMEMGTNGPIDLDGGLSSPLTLGYWYNSGASYRADGGAGSDDKSTPAQGSFAFTSLS